jgi:hypothetical protein
MGIFDALDLDFHKKQAMAKALAEARRNCLAQRVPENVANDSAYNAIDLSLKVWDVLSGLLEIAGTVASWKAAWVGAKISTEAIAASEAAAMASAAAGGSTKVTLALTAGEAMTLAGPLVAYIGLWVGLGAPYLEAKQKIADDHARRGIAHGVLVSAYGYRPERARDFAMRQPETANNLWIPSGKVVAQNSYRMAFIAGYKQGREMSQNQRKVFWKVFANSLRKEKARLWDNDWQGDGVWDRWFWEAGGVFQKHHIKG